MFPLRLSALVLLCSSLLTNAFAQQITASTDPPARDPQAIAVISRSLSAMGAAAIHQGQTVVVSGTITLQGSPSKAFPIIITSRGNSQIRTELTTDKGVRVTVISNGHGIIRQPDGSVRYLLDDNLISTRVEHLPQLSILSEFLRSDMALKYIGTSALEGAQVDVIDASLISGTTSAEAARSQERTRTLFFFNSTTGLPASVQRSNFAENSPEQSQVTETRFDDYRNLNGVMVPFRQRTFLDGTPLMLLQLNSADLNATATDAEFSLADGVQQ